MSWRKYGGTNKLDKFNNVTVNSIVADTFTIRDAFLSVFKVQGDLTILGDGLISQSMTVQDTTYTRNLDVSENAIIEQNLYLNREQNVFLKGSNGMIGLNISTMPTAAFDISTNKVNALNVKTSNVNNRNILARNLYNNGIALNATGTVSSSIQFYNTANGNVDASNNPQATIKYVNASDQIIIDTGGDLKMTTNVIVTNRELSDDTHLHLNDETMIIYDTSNATVPYFGFDAYENTNAKLGNALTLVAVDNQSLTQMNITTPNKLGFQLGGGSYPNDTNRSMGYIDVYNPISSDPNSFGLDTNAPPAQMIITGNSIVRYHTVTGFNTFAPKVDRYTVDINGAIHINNGEIALTFRPTSRVFKINFFGERGIAIGGTDNSSIGGTNNYYTYLSINGGESWTRTTSVIAGTNNGGLTINANRTFNSIYSLNTNVSIIGGTDSFSFITTDGGSNWILFSSTLGVTTEITATYMPTASIAYLGYNGAIKYGTIELSGTQYQYADGSQVIPVPGFNISHGSGYVDKLIFVGGKKRNTYSLGAGYLNPTLDISSNIFPDISGAYYNAVHMFNSTYAVAVGNNVISYTKNAGQTWTDINLTSQSVELNDVFIYDTTYAIAVGNFGKIYITVNASLTWNLLDLDSINSSGVGDRVINSAFHLNSVSMTDITSFIISSVPINTATRSSKLFYLHMPNIFDRENNYVMDISGSVQMSGDLHIIDGGKISTSNTTFDIATEATNINLGGLQLTFPDVSGNVYVNNTMNITSGNITSLSVPTSLTVGSSGTTILYNTSNPTNTISGALQVRGGVALTGDMYMGTSGKMRISNTQDMLVDPSSNPIYNTIPALLVDGGAWVRKNLDVEGALIINSTASSSGIFTGALRVKGGAGIEGSVYVGGEIHTTGGVLTGTTDNQPYINTSLNNVNLASPYETGGISTRGGMYVGKILYVESDIITPSTININSTLSASSTVTGALKVAGGVGIGESLHVSNYTKIYGTNASTNTVTGALQVAGGVGIGGSVNINGTTTLNGQLNASNASISGTLNTSTITASSVVSITDQSVSTNTATGALQISGGMGILGNINSAGILKIVNTTSASNTNSGALVVSGGVGINGDVFVGGSQTTSGSLSVAGFRSSANSTVVGTLATIALSVNGTNTNTLTTSGSTNIGGGTNTTVSGTSVVVNALTSGGTMNMQVNSVTKSQFSETQTTFTNTNTTVNSSDVLQLNSNTVNITSVGGLQIVGEPTFNNKTRITDTSVSTNTNTGALIVSGGLGVGGDVNFSGVTNISNQVTMANATVSNGLTVNGQSTLIQIVSITSTIVSTNTATGALIVAGGVGIGGNLFIGGSISSQSGVGGSLALSGFNSTANSTVTGSLVVTQSVTIVGSLRVTGSETIAGSLAVTGLNSSANSTVTGSLSVTQSATIGGSIWVAGSQTIVGSLTVVSNVVATNTATGALRVTGGIGIGGNVFAGGRVNVAPVTTQSVSVTVNPTYAIVGGFINSSTSTVFTYDGTTWTGRGSSVFTNRLTNAYWNGTIWVGVGSGTIATSSDGGITWIPRTASMFSEVRQVVWASSLGLWAAIGDGSTNVGGTFGGCIATSTDGITWTTRMSNTTSTTFANYGFAIDWNGTTFIAGGGTLSTGNSIATSTDGINWVGRGTTTATEVSLVYWSAALNLWIANRGNADSSSLMTSTDNGVTWTFSASSGQRRSALGWDGTRFIAGSSQVSGLTTSTDGTTWTATASSPVMNLSSGIGYINGKWIVVGQGTNTVSISTNNGSTWTGLGTTIFGVAGFGVAYNSALTTSQTTTVIDSTNTATGALQVTGGVGIGGNVFAGANVNITSTRSATNTATGGLVVSGGVGIGGNVFAGANVNITSTRSATNTATGALIVSGGVGIRGDISLGGSILLESGTVVTRLGYNAAKIVPSSVTGYIVGTTSTEVTAIGYNAMPVARGGYYQYVDYIGGYTNAGPIIAIGTNALENMIYGSDIIAIGADAGRYMKFNTASVGGLYGRANNTAIGHSSQQGQDTSTINSGTENTSIGFYTLVLNTTGSDNVAVGYFALYPNTTGNYNVATGSQALSANTTGSNNVATGYQALGANTTGGSNTAFGTEALSTNSTGSENVAIGYRSLFANQTASYNTATGYGALYSNSTGANNVATGKQALLNNSTGNRNTAIGVEALVNNTTGGNSVATGHQALYSCTTGGNNVASGYFALGANTTGSWNTATGHQALQGVTTGNYNVGIGFQAGISITTGSLNTCIGPSTNTINSATNCTIIGNSASANASNLVILGNSAITALRCQVQTITALSDLRDKKDIRDLEMGMNFVKALRPVRFMWNMRDGGKVDIPEIGFIAQEVIEAGGRQIPNLVDETDEDKLLVGQMAMFPVVIKAIQELNTQLNTANATIAEQGRMIEKLFEEISIMKAMISTPI
jgi:hypothetical protein